MRAYNSEWPSQFETIRNELAGDLADEGLPFLSIEHVGSTSVPNLPAKPIIDILVVIRPEDFNAARLEEFKEALSWGRRQGGYHYNGEGGVKGRWSFKLWEKEPIRHVYVVGEGSMPVRNCLALRDTLRRHSELSEEYGRLKIGLAQREYDNIMQYSTLKNPVIRKILTEAGWTDEEIDEKEAQSVTDFSREWQIMPKRTCGVYLVSCFFAIAHAPSRCWLGLQLWFSRDGDGDVGKGYSETDSDSASPHWRHPAGFHGRSGGMHD